MGKKYDAAIVQAERSQLCDHLKHDEVQERVLKVLESRTEFKKIVTKTLFGSVRFWLYMAFLSLGMSIVVYKFPELTAWIFSVVSKSG
jgi:hypothetical protein